MSRKSKTRRLGKREITDYATETARFEHWYFGRFERLPFTSPRLCRGSMTCARHVREPGGASPLRARQQEPLAEGKGVRREAESEGSLRQSPKPTNRNRISRLVWSGRVCVTTRSPMLPDLHTVDAAVTWDESTRAYPGRSCESLIRRQPVQRCTAKSQEVSRGHSTAEGK
jgi:hypothetical protein